MNENEQLYSRDENDPAFKIDDYDYNREPPLDSATVRENRRSSKYVFMTLCFLLALIMFYTYFNGTFADVNSTNWFPLIAALVLTIMGVVFLRSPDSPPEEAKAPAEQTPTSEQPADSEEMPLSDFENLVQEALTTIPPEFQEKMENVIVHVVPQPDANTLERMEVKEGHILLGLYEGVPLTAYGRQPSSYPEVITIYQYTIEAYCQHDPERIREQVRSTVLHEVAHHFGMGHEEMPIWIK
jgi:predicted Zn-dependent protease with MMP-like domain